MRSLVFAALLLMIAPKSNGQTLIPQKIRETADSINLAILGNSHVSKSQYACGQTFFKSAVTRYDCMQTKNDKESKNDNVVFYSLYYVISFTPNSNFFYKINLDPNRVLIDDVEVPNCAYTTGCNVQVDSLQAIEYAFSSGLDRKHLTTSEGLVLNPQTMMLVWQIRSQKKKSSTRGMRIWIDAYTGERIREADAPWATITIPVN